MTDPKRKYYEKRANVLIKNLHSRHFEACYCADKAEALKKALEWIPAGSSVGWGGAMSAQQIGLLDAFRTGDYRALDRERVWEFTPTAAAGDKVRAGDAIGWVPEGIVKHRIMVPFAWKGEWTLREVKPAGEWKIDDVMAVAVNEQGESRNITMTQFWPVKIPITDYAEKLLPEKTLITQQRSIDTFFPVAVGGTFCTPGPFGAGKTVLLATHDDRAIRALGWRVVELEKLGTRAKA